MFNFNSGNYRKLLLSLALISTQLLFNTISSNAKPVSAQIVAEQSTNWINSIWRRKPKRTRGARSGSLSQVCPIAPGLVDTYKVWSDRPLFLWQYSGANKQVELIVSESGSQQNLWKKTVNLADEKTFYEAQKALEPGKLYEWKLSETSVSGLFKIMPAEERENISQQLQALEKQSKNSQKSSEGIALKKADFFFNYQIKHESENKTFSAWSDALMALYQVEQPSQSFVNNRQQLVASLCTSANSSTSQK